jgi:hypothetical protein
VARVGFRLINGIDRMWPMLLEAEIPHSDKRTYQDLAPKWVPDRKLLLRFGSLSASTGRPVLLPL